MEFCIGLVAHLKFEGTILQAVIEHVLHQLRDMFIPCWAGSLAFHNVGLLFFFPLVIYIPSTSVENP